MRSAAASPKSTTRENFRIAHDISSYSLTAIAKAALADDAGTRRLTADAELSRRRTLPSELQRHGSREGQSGSERTLPGVGSGSEGHSRERVSAGPIKTLAAAGIGGFRKILGYVAATAPLRRNVTIEDVGNTAAFLCSDLASGITGEIIYVDGGFNTVGMSLGDEVVVSG